MGHKAQAFWFDKTKTWNLKDFDTMYVVYSYAKSSNVCVSIA